MLERLREFFRSPAGMGVAGALVLLGLVIAASSIRGFTTTEAGNLSADRMFIDAKTGKAYGIELKVGMPFPAPAPSGGNTGYPAEACYWTKDGKPKKDPTYVLLNIFKDSSAEPTFCPDCGRLVTLHNPAPGKGSPPPTKEEYQKTRK